MPKRVLMGDTYTPWQTRISWPLRARRDRDWSTAALLPKCRSPFGCKTAPSGNAETCFRIRVLRLVIVFALSICQNYTILSDTSSCVSAGLSLQERVKDHAFLDHRRLLTSDPSLPDDKYDAIVCHYRGIKRGGRSTGTGPGIISRNSGTLTKYHPDTVVATGSTSTSMKECGYSFIASPSSSRDHWGISPFTWEYDTVFMIDSRHRSSAFRLKILVASLLFTAPS